MDTNGVITISSKDWSKQPMLEKTENIPEIILYWKHSTVSPTLCKGPQNLLTGGFLQWYFIFTRTQTEDLNH